jgi:hypothetical protein
MRDRRQSDVAMKKYSTDAAIQLDDGRHGVSPSGGYRGRPSKSSRPPLGLDKTFFHKIVL